MTTCIETKIARPIYPSSAVPMVNRPSPESAVAQPGWPAAPYAVIIRAGTMHQPDQYQYDADHDRGQEAARDRDRQGASICSLTVDKNCYHDDQRAAVASPISHRAGLASIQAPAATSADPAKARHWPGVANTTTTHQHECAGICRCRRAADAVIVRKNRKVAMQNAPSDMVGSSVDQKATDSRLRYDAFFHRRFRSTSVPNIAGRRW